MTTVKIKGRNVKSIACLVKFFPPIKNLISTSSLTTAGNKGNDKQLLYNIPLLCLNFIGVFIFLLSCQKNCEDHGKLFITVFFYLLIDILDFCYWRVGRVQYLECNFVLLMTTRYISLSVSKLLLFSCYGNGLYKFFCVHMGMFFLDHIRELIKANYII